MAIQQQHVHRFHYNYPAKKAAQLKMFAERREVFQIGMPMFLQRPDILEKSFSNVEKKCSNV
jgi:hypothetical protein